MEEDSILWLDPQGDDELNDQEKDPDELHRGG
jgi:hypothetical protein